MLVNLLHIQAQQAVKRIFIDFPKRAAAKGEAEGKKRHKGRGEGNAHLLAVIQPAYQDKTERAQHGAGEEMQDYMKKFITASGETLVGHAALRDTMKDIIVDAVAALLMAVLGYGQLKLARGGKSQRDMPR